MKHKNEWGKDLLCSMFTGIVESLGMVKSVITNGSNLSFWVESPVSETLKPDQSVSHDGVCLTVEEVLKGSHRVTAIKQTLEKTNIGSWQTGTKVNLERGLLLNTHIDGHLVQGHVDCTAVCTRVEEKDGSRELTFRFPRKFGMLMIEKGSVTVNGISLTAFDVKNKRFSVAIVPYTANHTNIGTVEVGSPVNLEFDIIGKYLLRQIQLK